MDTTKIIFEIESMCGYFQALKDMDLITEDEKQKTLGNLHGVRYMVLKAGTKFDEIKKKSEDNILKR